jgi:hypothetical protein
VRGRWSFFRGVPAYSITGIEPLPRGCVTVEKNGILSVGSLGPAPAHKNPDSAPWRGGGNGNGYQSRSGSGAALLTPNKRQGE